MQITVPNWIDYELIDAGKGEKIERWGEYTLRRPESGADWPIVNGNLWSRPDAVYKPDPKGQGTWTFNKELPASWTITYKNLTFKIAPTPFKHTGLFPEQAVNWDWMSEKIRKDKREVRILNLFAYTGGATLACASAGAEEVVHVEASKSTLNWAKENCELSGLSDKKIRFISEDALKFVEREKRRGHTYHGIIMDPPAFGRGPNGEVWKFNSQLEALIVACKEILDPQPLFFIVNAYSDGFKTSDLHKVLLSHFRTHVPTAFIDCVDLGLPLTSRELLLACGISGRIHFK